MAEIQTVKQWAVYMGFESVKYFSRKIRDAFGCRPKQTLIEAKLRYIEERFSKSGDADIWHYP
jgi:AraC-like DNA-binding protein